MMANKQLNILILGARAPIALELARSFASSGNNVIMSDCQSLTITRWSNCVSAYYKTASPRYSLERYKSDLIEIIEKEEINHVVPTCEEAFYISMIKSDLESYNTEVWVNEFELMHMLHRKDEFMRLVSQFISVPETINLEDFKDHENSSQYVFKRIYSRFAKNTLIGPSKKEFKAKLGSADKKDWIAQQKLNGVEYCVYSIWNQGKLKAITIYEPIVRVGKGSAIMFQSRIIPILEEKIHLLGGSLKFHGQVSFDVIAEGDEFYVIECNPRGTSGAHIIGDKLFDAFFEDSYERNDKEQSFSIKTAIWLTNPFKALSIAVRESNDVIWKKSDKKPLLMQPLSIFEIVYIAVKERKSLLKATTSDIEWNGE